MNKSLEANALKQQIKSSVTQVWKLTAIASLRETDPEKSAELWSGMSEICKSAVTVLKHMKQWHPGCDTAALRKLITGYRKSADLHARRNLQHAAVRKTRPMKGVFPGHD